MVGVGLHRFRREERATHVEGDEDPRRHEALPALSRDLLDDSTGDDEHQAVVSPLRAGGTAGLEESKAVVELIAREWGLVPEEIMPGQSALVGEKIPRRQSRRRHRVLQGKIGKVRAYGSVERDPSLVREQSDRRCRERLRAGPEREERVGRDRQVLVDIAVTEAAREDEVSPLDDSHGHARNLVTCHETANEGREIVGKPRFAARLVAERRQAHGHEERCQDRPWPPHATARSGTSSGIRKRQIVRRIITLEKKTSPMNRPMPRCNPIVAMHHTFRVRRGQMKNT